MSVLYTASTAAELGGSMQAFASRTAEVSTAYEDGSGTFVGFDPDFASEAAGVQHSAPTAFIINTAEPTGDYWFHARLSPPRFVAHSDADGYWWTFYDAAGLDIARLEVSDGSLHANAIGDTSVVSAGTFSLAEYLPVMVDIRIAVGADIVVDLYVSGTLVGTATAANTGSKGKPVRMSADHFDIVSSGSSTGTSWVFYSEVLILDGESTVGLRLASQAPNTQGNSNDMTGDPSHLMDAGDGLTVSSDTAGHKEGWTLSGYNGPVSPTSIRAVVTKTKTNKGLTGPQNIRHFLRIGTTDYDNGADLGPSQEGEMHVWDNNPATASPWTTSDLSGLEQGVEVKA